MIHLLNVSLMKKHLHIHPIPSLKDNYIWALVDSEKGQVSIVDPGDGLPVEDFLSQEQLDLQGIIITHHHWDHTDGIEHLVNKYQIPVYGPDNPKIKGLSEALGDGARVPIEICPLDLSVIAIPGHTLDHLAYYAPGVLFCGDTLFAAGCGRVFEGSSLQMYHSLQKLAALPDETKVYCAHEYTVNNLRFAQMLEPENLVIAARLDKVQALRTSHLPSLPSSMSEEKETNPFLRCSSPELRAKVEDRLGRSLADPIEVFTWLRKWKDEFKSI